MDYGGNTNQYILKEVVVGQISGARAIVQDISGDPYNGGSAVVAVIGDTPFQAEELMVGSTSGAQAVVKSFMYDKGYI